MAADLLRLAETERRIQILEGLLGGCAAVGCASPPEDPSLASVVATAEAAASSLACLRVATASTTSFPGGGASSASQVSCAEEDRREHESSLAQDSAAQLPQALVLSLWAPSSSSASLASPRCSVTGSRALAAPSRRCGGPPLSARRESSAPAGAASGGASSAPSGSATPRGSTPGGTQRRLSTRPSSPRAAGAEEAAASVTAALQQLEPRLAQPLRQRLATLTEQLEAARAQIREQSRQNAEFQRSLEQHKDRMARVLDYEGHNRIFSTRKSEDTKIFECLPQLHAQERLEWERCRLACEDLAVERRRAADAGCAARRRRESQRMLAEGARAAEARLRELDLRLEELHRVHAEGAKKEAENRTLLRRLEKMRNGNPRWR